jgi:hypothetical protein
MPEKQQIYDMALAGLSGAATSWLHKIKVGQPVTAKSVVIDAGLAACSMVLAYIVCSMLDLSQEMSRAVYFGSGWLGSRVIAIVERKADDKIEEVLDDLTDRIQL